MTEAGPSGATPLASQLSGKILAKLEKFLTELKAFDKETQMDLLIETAERFIDVPERIAKRPFDCENRVPSCESEAYIWAEKLPDGNLKFHFAVENPQGISAKSLAVILDENLSGLSPTEILNLREDVVYDIFGKDLSMGKGAGLMSMVRMVKALAR